MKKRIIFFADKLPPLIGGMEIHAKYFMQHFKSHPNYDLRAIITKNSQGQDCLLSHGNLIPTTLKTLKNKYPANILFFNSGRWIEDLVKLRTFYPDGLFCYRTGGNEILKAPLERLEIPRHLTRQKFWVRSLNNTIDYLITNSDFTQNRLSALGITCQFIKCVGGVDIDHFKDLCTPIRSTNTLKIFCAARFVPYKNYHLLIQIFKRLVDTGFNVELKIAGDGPLKNQIEDQVKTYELGPFVQFLGGIENAQVCTEIFQADVYMQLSSDYLTSVPGGQYIHCEGMGRSILEAITAGTFVIAGRSGALDEIVTPDRGLLIDLENIDASFCAIEQVLKNLPKEKTLITDYSWDHIFECYKKLFEGTHK